MLRNIIFGSPDPIEFFKELIEEGRLVLNPVDGRFYLCQTLRSGRKSKPKLLGRYHSKDGYYIRIDTCRILEHELVILYYYGYIPSGDERIRRKNRNKKDNRIENLEIAKKKAIKRLTPEQVKDLKRRLRDGWPFDSLAIFFNISITQVMRIRDRIQWKEID